MQEIFINLFENNAISLPVLILLLFLFGFNGFLKSSLADRMLSFLISGKLGGIKDHFTLPKEALGDKELNDFLLWEYRRVILQKKLGVRDYFLQKEIAKILQVVSGIPFPKYFSSYQFFLTFDSDNRIFIDINKIKKRKVEVLFLICYFIFSFGLVLSITLYVKDYGLFLIMFFMSILSIAVAIFTWPPGGNRIKKAQQFIDEYYKKIDNHNFSSIQ